MQKGGGPGGAGAQGRGGLVKAADKRLAVSQVRTKAGQVVRVDKAVPEEEVVVGKNKCGPAGAK